MDYKISVTKMFVSSILDTIQALGNAEVTITTQEFMYNVKLTPKEDGGFEAVERLDLKKKS